VLLVGQFRYALDAYSWEIPEGAGRPGETALDSALRELREETGYTAADWRELARCVLSNSVTDERGDMYVATGLRPGVAAPDATEDLEIRWASLDEVLAEIAEGRIHDLMTIAAVYRYALEGRER